MSREHQSAVVQGQTNRGEALSGVIPGTSESDMAQAQFAAEKAKGK